MGLFSTEISTKELVPLCRQIATSYEAGIPIVRSLALVSENARSKTARGVLTAMREQIQQGATLGDAARAQKGRLPDFFVELLAGGEAGGRLDVMLRDLAAYYEDRLEMQRRIVGALTYPAFQMTIAWFLGTFALGLIGGLDLKSGNDFSFPKYIQGYLAFQGAVITVSAIVIVVLAALTRGGAIRWIWGWISNHVWPLKDVARKFALARFFRGMSLLIGAGMDIRSCIHNSARMVINPYIERDLLRAVPLVNDGATLTQAFAGSRSLTPTAREMIFVGEQSGNLDGALRKVSELHLAEAQHAVNVAAKVMNVLIVLAVGGTIGYIVISFYAKYLGQLDSIANL